MDQGKPSGLAWKPTPFKGLGGSLGQWGHAEALSWPGN
jgi:hypothetical protein